MQEICRQRGVGNFGECICGVKDDHTADALAAGTKGGPKHGERDSAEVRASFVQEFVECKKYVVNMGANFGECICGAEGMTQPEALAAATKGGRSTASGQRRRARASCRRSTARARSTW